MAGKNNIKKDDVSAMVTQKTRWHSNLDQDNVVTTEDKIRICLMTYLKNLQSRDTWMAPLGVALTLVLTFLTTDFKDFYFSADTWQAFFLIAFILSGVWLVVSLVRRPKALGVDDIVMMLKSGANDGDTEATDQKGAR